MAHSKESEILRLNVIQSALLFGTSFVQSIVVARFLAPEQIGAYSVAVASVILLAVFKSSGVGIYLLKEKTVTRAHVHRALTISLALSLTALTVLLLVREPVARFYEDPVIAEVLLIVSFSYLLSPFNAVASSMLTRAMMFQALLYANVWAAVAGTVTTLGLAIGGAGAVAMAWGELATASVATILMWRAGPDQLSIGLSCHRLREILSLSTWTMAGDALNRVGGRSSELVIGKTLGLFSAAQFDRSEVLPRLVWSIGSGAFFRTFMPVMAAELRQGIDPRSAIPPRLTHAACILTPAFMASATHAEPLIVGLYGEQWLPAIPLVFWVCLSSAVVAPFVTVNAALTALGRVRQLFVFNLVEQATRFTIVFLLAYTDILLIAMSLLIVAISYVATVLATCSRTGLLSVRLALSAIRPGIEIAIALWLIGTALDVLVSRAFGDWYILRSAIGGTVLFTCWLGLLKMRARPTYRLILGVLPARFAGMRES